MKCITAIVIFFLIGMGLAVGQSTLIKRGKFAGLVGYNYNQRHWAEIGLVRGYRANYDHDPSLIASEMFYSYAFVSSEFLMGNTFIMCPKFGYHIVLAVLDIGVQVIDYTDFHTHKFGIQPEIGLSFAGVLGVYYRYNLTTNKDAFDISNNNIGIKIIVGSGLFIDGDWRKKHNRTLQHE